jgi:hypothetical protein
MEKGRRSRRWRIASALVASAACRSPEPSAGARTGSVLAALLAAADSARAPWRCAADVPPLADTTFTLGEHHWHAHGNVLHLDDDAHRAAIGVVANAGGASPSTLAAIGRVRARFDHDGVALVLALGGMGTTQAELEAGLRALADRASFPVVALPGDLEAVPALIAALATLQARGMRVVDGRLATAIELPTATIATLPGAGAKARLVAGVEGCAWRTADVAHVFQRQASRAGLRIVATSEAPRKQVAGEPSGELALLAPRGSIDVVVHGSSRAGSRPSQGHRDGVAASLSPGSVDASSTDDGPHTATAGVLVIEGDAWSWQPVIDRPER